MSLILTAVQPCHLVLGVDRGLVEWLLAKPLFNSVATGKTHQKAGLDKTKSGRSGTMSMRSEVRTLSLASGNFICWIVDDLSQPEDTIRYRVLGSGDVREYSSLASKTSDDH